MADYYNGLSTSSIFKLWMISVILLGYCLGQDEKEEEFIVNNTLVKFWADKLGELLNEASREHSGIDFLLQKYKERESDLNIKDRKGKQLLDDVNAAITEFLKKKVEAVGNIVVAAEDAFKNYYDYSTEPPTEYRNALNNSLEDVFMNITGYETTGVLYSNSTIHVPTVVYDKDPDLLRGINATSVLDQVFQDNLEKDTSLTWQYFGSTIGYMRNYPGVLWNLPVTDDKVLNLFDSRRRSWYSQAVAPPKTVLFMVDVSGSQTGLAIGMTRLMVNSTIDSLDGNDFFNILTFNDTTKVVESCYENTLVQATYENKEYMKGRLQAIEPHEESNVCNAFDKAFDALARMRGGAGNNCSETIMLFTDGVEFTCEEVFQARNANKSVRVFTYLLGELVQHAKILQRIACNNHGMYSRIRVRSDVPETVAEYLPILGRPLAQEGVKPIVWTNTYRDFKTNNLTISVSQPVHNQTAIGKATGNVIGAAGVDIPLESIQRIASPYKFGVNGYFFMITNNGYVTSHPQHKFESNGWEIPGISTQDITDIEQSESSDELRESMINQDSGNMTMSVEVTSDDMRRVVVLRPTYFYSPISSTPFSLAVVLDKDGNKVIDPPKLIQVEGDKIILAEDQDNLTYAIAALEGINGLKLAEWVPCELIANFTVTLPNEKMVVQFLKEVVAKKKLTVRCDIDWINLLLLDLNITNGYNESLPSTYSSDFISSFVATTSGLNQECLYQKVEDGVCQVRDSTESFTLNHPNTLAEDYFQRALNDAVKKNPEDIAFVYSAPLKGNDEINLVVNDTLVTAYSALKFTDKVVAVAGVQMSLSSVLKVFNDVTSMTNPDCEIKEERNDPKQCEHTCDTPGISCVLMDSDGYILACKDETEIGSHIAKAEPILFENMLYKGFFNSLSYIDHQGLCKINMTYHPASGWSLLNPLSQMKNLMMGLTERFILILMTFNWYEWLSVLAMPTVVPPEDTTIPTENINITTRDEEYRRCDLDYRYYKLNNSLLSNANDVGIANPAYCPEDCKNSYSMFSVPNTNLVLLVLASTGCDTCNPLPKLYVPEATEFGYNTSEELRCDSLWKPRLRLAPDSCSLSTNVSKSMEVDCSSSFLRPSWILLALATFHLFVRSCLV
ncbi:voltage-dependent calcium channel subunit alpha-2/delta-3-like isoform X2 [Apostichopus japonicus]|uniref:voltage-dependent calcium channel subunit alpha-2/delta-3-like isoform X2 n=1 Tax=Stichopus japonicus TaxID=307972 RepID=UPI003AB7BFD8